MVITVLSCGVGRIAGPRTGKPSPYSGMQIPINNIIPLIRVITRGLSDTDSLQPILKPSNPVVKGKINNSPGSNKTNRNIADK